MQRLFILLIFIPCFSFSQVKDTTQVKRNLKIGANWAPMFLTNVNEAAFLSRFALTLNFNDRHTITVGPSFIVDFDFRFEYMDKPFFRLGYQYHPFRTERKLKYYLTYGLDYHRNKGDYKIQTKVDGTYQYPDVEITYNYLAQPAGFGVRWYLLKKGYLQLEGGAAIWTNSKYYDFKEDNIEDYRSTSNFLMPFVAVGIGYDFGN